MTQRHRLALLLLFAFFLMAPSDPLERPLQVFDAIDSIKGMVGDAQDLVGGDEKASGSRAKQLRAVANARKKASRARTKAIREGSGPHDPDFERAGTALEQGDDAVAEDDLRTAYDAFGESAAYFEMAGSRARDAAADEMGADPRKQRKRVRMRSIVRPEVEEAAAASEAEPRSDAAAPSSPLPPSSEEAPLPAPLRGEAEPASPEEPTAEAVSDAIPRPLSTAKIVDVRPPEGGVSLGSTPGDRRYAMALCESHVPACESGWYSTENERHTELGPYRIDAFEVTNGEFAEFVKDTGYVTTAEQLGYGYGWTGSVAAPMTEISWRSPAGPESDYRKRLDRPVTVVSWFDANAYCRWRGGSLPTEDQWEFAARSSERFRFPWGDEWTPARAVWKLDDPMQVPPVGSVDAGRSPSGLYDMAGGVWEWTEDVSGEKATLKGGSWAEANPANLRPAAHRLSERWVAHTDDGVRCAYPAAATP